LPFYFILVFWTNQLQEDQNGQRQILDIGKLLKIPDATPIQTFEVKQLDDRSILLCLATRAEENKSNLIICRPFQITMTPQINTLPVQTITEVQRIYLVSMHLVHFAFR
jgi:hypothetical protein